MPMYKWKWECESESVSTTSACSAFKKALHKDKNGCVIYLIFW